MLEEDTGVLFVDADGILGGYCGAGAVAKFSVEVVDYALAVASESVKSVR